jgi:hypothetical protein
MAIKMYALNKGCLFIIPVYLTDDAIKNLNFSTTKLHNKINKI